MANSNKDNNSENDFHKWIQSLGIIGALLGSVYMFTKFQSTQNELQIKIFETESAIKQLELIKATTPIYKIDCKMTVTKLEDAGNDGFSLYRIDIPVSVENTGDNFFSVSKSELSVYRGVKRPFPGGSDKILLDNTPGSDGNIDWSKPEFVKSDIMNGLMHSKSHVIHPMSITVKCKSGECIGYTFSIHADCMKNQNGYVTSGMLTAN